MTDPKLRKAIELQELAQSIRTCRKCPLCESRIHAVPGTGSLSSPIFIIGEAPGQQEDKKGQPFVGAAGRFLDQLLAGIQLKRDDCFITNIVKCRPPQNRIPRKGEVETCTSLYLFKQIELIQPKLILLLGGVAAKKILGLTSIASTHGQILEHKGQKYFVSYHPAVCFYRDDLTRALKDDFLQLRQEILKLGA